MIYADRREAARKLVVRLRGLNLKSPVVVGLPRGGVVLARVVADAIGCEMSVLPVRKIGHPENPEFAIGAVADKGPAVVSAYAGAEVDPAWLRQKVSEERAEAVRRSQLYRTRPVRYRHREVVVLDDGMATGQTMAAAVRWLWQHRPGRVVVCVPVASEEARAIVQSAGAECVIDQPVRDFRGAVGAHYQSFPQLSDADVLAELDRPVPLVRRPKP